MGSITYVILTYMVSRDVYNLEQFTLTSKNEKTEIPDDYSDRIKALRGRLGITQKLLANKLEVSFATVNRWENRQSKPSPLSWKQIEKLYHSKFVEREDEGNLQATVKTNHTARLDFTGSPEGIRTLVEGERLSYGHLYNPVFATEISKIDPLPHQRIAVYDHMLKHPRLRFLLADDAGAGKTIMAGLYIREMLARKIIHRVLIVPPAGLVGNWQREMETLFDLSFSVVSGPDCKNNNPFAQPDGKLAIVSVDTLVGERAFSRLREEDTKPYDLVIFDEAHKLSAQRSKDFRVTKTGRYQLAEALAGIRGIKKKWQLSWTIRHLLLLTATPHMGKEYPYYALWRLLEPNALSTIEAFEVYPKEARNNHFIRRTKEEMVKLDGSPLYPVRKTDTLSYSLSQGELSEQRLYEETTDYLKYVYNRAKLLNRTAAQLAMTVFQRRLASSTYALERSFERRLEKLDAIISDVCEGKITEAQLLTLQQRLSKEDDVLISKTADEEETIDGKEENEIAEDKILSNIIATSLNDLQAERKLVNNLQQMARKVQEAGLESKFDKLRHVITRKSFANEKLLVFTEHKDTLEYLVRRLSAMGYADQIATIHGGMHYKKREAQVEFFHKPHDHGGARFMIATDAAGEGINLQFCWIMVNYDVPWNPARLEQRMGRIHRYGQDHDPVVILNLVAAKTREGKVLKTLLEKLEVIRKELKSDKVFDVIGRVFEDLSITDYMQKILIDENEEAVEHEIEGKLTSEQVQALLDKEKRLYGDGGDVKKELGRLREEIERETYIRLLPGYVRRYVEGACKLTGIRINGSLDNKFWWEPMHGSSIDPVLTALESYPDDLHHALTVKRPVDRQSSIWLHPGESVFESFREMVKERLSDKTAAGAVFVDASATRPYILHIALVNCRRLADPEIEQLSNNDVLEYRLVAIKQEDGGHTQICPVEQLLLLRDGQGISTNAQRLAVAAEDYKDMAYAYLLERVARSMANEHRNQLLSSLKERRDFIQRGFDYQEKELAQARVTLSKKAREGNARAIREVNRVKEEQRELAQRRSDALLTIEREPELIVPGSIEFIAHALVVPSKVEDDKRRQDQEVEVIAMRMAQAYEETLGAKVHDVHTSPLSRAVGLGDTPGFDLLSIRKDKTKLGIEVKGRVESGAIEMTENEWAKACNLRQNYWLYVVYDCGTSHPRLLRIQDPFARLIAKAKGGVLINESVIVEVAEK